MSSLVQENIETLKKNYAYFSSLSRDKFDWIRERFVKSSCLDLTLDEDEELTNISSDRTLIMKHKGVPLDPFVI